MDIWDWVIERETQYWEKDPEFAGLIQDFPSWVVNQDDKAVENAYPVALQKCKTHQDTWLEVFFRHWYMQLQIFQKVRVNDLENDIVDLLNFAHKGEAINCPQSTCVVQDFCHFYYLKDGPGYVEERKSIAREVLEKITPDWACYGCITSEYVGALVDERKTDEAINFLKQQKQSFIDAGNSFYAEDFDLDFADIHNETGEYEKAINLLKDNTFETHGKAYMHRRNFTLAFALAHSGKGKEAEILLPPFDEVTRSDHIEWIETKVAIAKAENKSLTKNELDHFLQLTRALEKNGIYRHAFNLYKLLYREYQKCGLTEDAKSVLTALHSAAQNLRNTDKALEEIAKLQEGA